ncbi:MAG: RNA methyltransferase [Bacillota bacterium]|nr:RNA methyltransferase [Bacillota bacterium]
MIEIESASNPLIKFAVSLQKRSVRKETFSFVVEGHKLIEEALKSGFPIETIFVEQNSEKKYDNIVKCANTVAAVPYRLLQKICESDTPQNIAAICKIKEKEYSNLPLKNVLVLENIQDPGNFGTLLRTAECFGIDAVVTIGTAVDPFSRKVLRSGMGSSFRMNVIHFDKAGEAFNFFKENNITVYAGALRRDAKSLEETSFEQNSAVAVGNEGSGLSEEFLAMADNTVFIPMSGEAESLNAAAAAAVMMWELYKKKI